MNGDHTSAAAAPRPRAMDLSPKRPGEAMATAKSATALHSRAQAAHVIDLRKSETHTDVLTKQLPTAPVSHAANHTPAPPPKSAVHERHIARFTDRFDRAKKYGRSEQISRFGPNSDNQYDKFGNPTLDALKHNVATTPATSTAPPVHHPPVAGSIHMPELPRQAATQHEAMAKLIPAAPPVQATATAAKASWRPHLKLSPHGSRAMAVTAAVAIMAGYVWLQNYPKMAIQSAGGRAGISASLPGYVPSSYSLAKTDSSPGLVTLSFSSPSAPETLTIAQHRTTWDSSSLLDNFVSKHADSYATVQGQGLTIYLFDDNRAAWVNHGIWYSIEGASRLSREQLLKVAFSL